MSVLIKGINILPKHCLECMFYRAKGQDYDYCCISSAIPKNYIPDDCPLVELPDHGDLIDRDALKATDSWEWIRHEAPVVIPAERGEEWKTQ